MSLNVFFSQYHFNYYVLGKTTPKLYTHTDVPVLQSLNFEKKQKVESSGHLGQRDGSHREDRSQVMLESEGTSVLFLFFFPGDCGHL